MPHDAGDSLAAGQYALIEKFGTHAWHAISGIAHGMRRSNVRQQCGIGRSLCQYVPFLLYLAELAAQLD